MLKTLSQCSTSRTPTALRLAVATACLLIVSGCANSYSPNTYSSSTMQQTNKVDRAVVKMVRPIHVKDSGYEFGVITGGTAGGVAGAQIGEGKGSALGAVGGALAGATAGALIQQKAGETDAFEYILEKSNGDLLTIAQKQDQPFTVGAHVLILYGAQARVIPDTLSHHASHHA